MSWWRKALGKLLAFAGRAAVEEWQQDRANPGNKAKKRYAAQDETFPSPDVDHSRRKP